MFSSPLLDIAIIDCPSSLYTAVSLSHCPSRLAFVVVHRGWPSSLSIAVGLRRCPSRLAFVVVHRGWLSSLAFVVGFRRWPPPLSLTPRLFTFVIPLLAIAANYPIRYRFKLCSPSALYRFKVAYHSPRCLSYISHPLVARLSSGACFGTRYRQPMSLLVGHLLDSNYLASCLANHGDASSVNVWHLGIVKH